MQLETHDELLRVTDTPSTDEGQKSPIPRLPGREKCQYFVL